MNRANGLSKQNDEMKNSLVLMFALLLPFTVVAAKKEKQNIMVWGEVQRAADGKDYLTMYKNCPAEVTAQFHFEYKDRTKSVMYDLVMPDTVAQVLDPVPVEKPVKQVVIDNLIYSTVDDDGNKYSTKDPDDPVLAMLLVDMFDIYHDIFWFDVAHRARYYNNRSYDNWTPNSSRYSNTHPNKSKAPDIDLDKLDDTALLLGAAAVAVASAGMLWAVAENWDRPDDRFPYLSMSPQVQYYFQTGNVRDVMEFKYRFGNYGGFSLMGDLGFCTGSLNHPGLFDRRFTWSIGAGMDLGAFSLSFHFKPSTGRYVENFLSCQIGYDIFVTRGLAIDLRTGVGIFEHEDNYYADVPLSVGLLWKF